MPKMDSDTYQLKNRWFIKKGNHRLAVKNETKKMFMECFDFYKIVVHDNNIIHIDSRSTSLTIVLSCGSMIITKIFMIIIKTF